MTGQRLRRKLAAILAADVVGFSRMVRSNEERTLAALKTVLDDVIAPEITAFDGRVFKTMGDGILAEFSSVVDAVGCAIRIQEMMASRSAGSDADPNIVLRIAVNLGDVVVDGADLYGDGVNVAARLEGIAEPGGITISASAYEQVRDKLAVGFEDLGNQRVKNIDRPVRAYAVRLDDPPEDPETAPVRRRSASWPWVAIILLVSGLGVAAVFSVWEPRLTQSPPAAPTGFTAASRDRMAYPLPDRPSVVVLPFADPTGVSDNDPVVGRLTADIRADLSPIDGLFVIAGNSSAALKDQPGQIHTVAEALGVRYVLQGEIGRTDTGIRVAVMLADAVDGRPVWTGDHDRASADMLSLPAEIARRMVSELAIEIDADDRDRLDGVRIDSLEAYRTYLRARRLFDLEDDAVIADERRALFEQVIALDPGFAGGYAGLSRSYTRELQTGRSEEREADIAHALLFGEKGVLVDPASAEPYLALARLFVEELEHEKAVATMEAAVAAVPNNADAYRYLGLFLHWAGRGSEAVAALQAFQRLDPQARDAADVTRTLAMAHFTAGQYAESIALLAPEFEELAENGDDMLAILSASYAAVDQPTNARTTMQALLRTHPDETLSTFEHPQRYAREEDRYRYLNLLRLAGMPTTWSNRSGRD